MKVAGAIRSSLIGDSIMSLPILNVLYKMYGHPPQLTMYLARKCKQAAPLFLFQKGINEIRLTNEEEFLSDIELKDIKDYYHLFINPTPAHSDPFWYNHRNCVEETMLQCGAEYHEVWKSLPKELQQPRLNPWWNNGEINKKTIAIHCVGGYSKGTHRAPNKEWWIKLINIIHNEYPEYEIIQFGHFLDFNLMELINNSKEVMEQRLPYYKNNLSLFEQIQQATKCEYYIGGDSGFSWILNAFGGKCISLMTRWENGHNQNDLALAPENWNGNNINLFNENINEIPIEKVLESIK